MSWVFLSIQSTCQVAFFPDCLPLIRNRKYKRFRQPFSLSVSVNILVHEVEEHLKYRLITVLAASASRFATSTNSSGTASLPDAMAKPLCAFVLGRLRCAVIELKSELTLHLFSAPRELLYIGIGRDEYACSSAAFSL